MRDEYKLLETSVHIEKCPCCGGAARLWRYSEDENAPTSKVVMCETTDAIGPQDGLANEGCPLYMPGNGHYKATEREALKYWNEFSKALTALQRKNRWEHSQILRTPEDTV